MPEISLPSAVDTCDQAPHLCQNITVPFLIAPSRLLVLLVLGSKSCLQSCAHEPENNVLCAVLPRRAPCIHCTAACFSLLGRARMVQGIAGHQAWYITLRCPYLLIAV